MMILDAHRRNPVRCKLIRVTETGGTIAEDDRGVRYFVPASAPDRILPDAPARTSADLFGPLMTWEIVRA